jgi:hypothetical protein
VTIVLLSIRLGLFLASIILDATWFPGAEASGIHGVVGLEQEWKQIIANLAVLQQKGEALTYSCIGFTDGTDQKLEFVDGSRVAGVRFDKTVLQFGKVLVEQISLNLFRS